MGFTDTYYGTAEQNQKMLAWMKKNGYASGVRNLKKDELAWTQEAGLEAIIRPSDSAILTPLKRGDSVLKASATNTLFDFANNPNDFIKDNLSIQLAEMPQAQGNTVMSNSLNLSLTLPNVTNYSEFVDAMKRDKQVENWVHSITTDRLVGGSPIRKYK